MITIETKKIKISEELKRKFEMICSFTNTKAKFFNGSVRNLKVTNIAYAEPHKNIINDILIIFLRKAIRYLLMIYVRNIKN